MFLIFISVWLGKSILFGNRDGEHSMRAEEEKEEEEEEEEGKEEPRQKEGLGRQDDDQREERCMQTVEETSFIKGRILRRKQKRWKDE